MKLTASSGQLLVIDGDTLHCFTVSDAKKLTAIIYERDECVELDSINDYMEDQYLEIINDCESQKNSMQQIIAAQKNMDEYYSIQIAALQKSLKKEVRRHKFTKITGLLVLTGLIGLAAL